jgi:hypothetical protein
LKYTKAMINSNNNSDNNPHTYFYMGMIAGSIIGFNGMILLTLLGLVYYNKENIIKNFCIIYNKNLKNVLDKTN